MEPKPRTRKNAKPRPRPTVKPKKSKKLVPKLVPRGGIRVSVADRVSGAERVSVADRVKLRRRMDEVQREIETLTREVEAAPLKERVRLRTELHHKEEERENLYTQLKAANEVVANRVTEGTLWTDDVTNPDVDLNAVNEVTNVDLNAPNHEVDLNEVHMAKPTLKERRTQNRQTRKQKKELRNMITSMTVREAALENFKVRKARNAERLNLQLAELELQKHQDRLAKVKRRMEEERTRKEREQAEREEADIESLLKRMESKRLTPPEPEPEMFEHFRTQKMNKIEKEPLHKRLFKGVRL